MAQKKTSAKGDKKGIVHEEIFGKSVSHTDPKDGISGTKIHANDIGNIPGTLEHWACEIEQRKSAILVLSERSFMKRAADMLSRKTSSTQISGEELSQLHPIKSVNEYVSQLKNKPEDASARSELVLAVGKASRSFSVENYRTMFLQAMTACNLGNLSTQGLHVAIWAQNMYFSKLFYKCSDGLESLKGALQRQRAAGASSEQLRSTVQSVRDVQRNMKILRAYQNYSSTPQKESSGTQCSINLSEIQALLLNEDAEEDKKTIEKKLIAVMSIARFVLLLHKPALEVLDLFIKLDQSNAIGHFLKARLTMSAMVFSMGRFEAGAESAKSKQEIQDNFKLTYHHYGLATANLNLISMKSAIPTILMEYAQSIFYFYNAAEGVLEMKLPRPWIKTALTNALKALMRVKDPSRTSELEQKIQRVMDNQGW